MKLCVLYFDNLSERCLRDSRFSNNEKAVGEDYVHLILIARSYHKMSLEGNNCVNYYRYGIPTIDSLLIT
jgi:hypothetical protein